MPPIVIAVVAAVAAYGGAAGAIALAATVGVTLTMTSMATLVAAAVVGSLAAMAAGMAMQAIAGKPKSTEQTAAEQKQMIRAGVAPRRIVYGQSKVSGPIVYAASSGDNMGVLHLVVPLADHVCQKIETVWLDDYPILESDMDGASVINGKFAGKVLIGKYNGTQTTADGILMSEAPDGWDSTHILSGITYLTLRLEYDQNVFQGVPNVSANVYGKADLYDPRTGLTGVYSDNWALCVLDYLRGAHGLDCDDDEIDMPFFIAAANLSDEAVQLDAANTIAQSRYTCNGSFTLDQTPINIMEGMLAAGGGALVYVAGKYRLHGGAYVAPSANLGPSDFAGPVELQTLPPRAELFNGVKGTFIDPLRFNQASDFPPVVNAAARTADGEDIWRDVQYTFVNDITRAQRLARMTLYRMRSPLTLRAPLRYASIQLAVWQTVAITLPDFGWTAKPFRITAYSFDPAAGTCTATLAEEQVAAYAWTYDAAIAVPDSPDTTLIDPLIIPAPTGLSLSSSTILQADGTVAAAVNVAWDAVLHAFVDAHEVQWKLTSDSIWNSRDVAMPTTSYTIAPVVPGGSYQVRVRGIAGLVRGPYTATGSVAGGADTTPPAVPTGLATAGVLHGISATWNLPADRDLVAVEVYAGTDTTTATRAFVGETLATGYVITGLPTAAGRYIWVRARDRSGNRSAYAGPVFGRASLVLADDLDDAIVSTAKFASGIAPVVLIPNLTTTAADNTTALNMADGKLYTRVAGAWVATVQPLGPGGTLTSAQIDSLAATKLTGSLAASLFPTNLRPTEVVAALPTTGNFEGRVVYLTTDDKIYRHNGTSPTTTAGWSKAVDGGDILSRSVTAQQIKAGDITGNEIAATTLTASKVVVADTTNMFPDPNMMDSALYFPQPAVDYFISGTSVLSAGTRRLQIPANAAGVTVTTEWFEIAPLVDYYAEMGVYMSTSLGATGVVEVEFGSMDSAGVATPLAPTVQIASTLTANTGSRFGAPLTAPATARRARFVITRLAGGTASANFGRPEMRRRANANLIVDGAIIAAKIASGAVTTAHLSVGSANVIWNSTCTRTADGWVAGSYGSAPAATLGAAIPTGNTSFVPRGLGGGFLRIPTVTVAAGSGAAADWRPDASFLGVPCLPGDKMQARALLGAHRCAVKIELLWINASGAEISRAGSTQTTAPAGGLNDSDFAAHTVLAVAPAGTVLALLRLTIVGNGGADPYLFWTKAALGEAPPNATEVGEWEPGGVTDISGGQLRTNSVTAEQINTTSLFADSGVFNDLKAGIGTFGGLTSTEIAAGEIKAVNLASTTLLTTSAQIGSLIVDTFSIGGNAVTSHASALINTPNITGSAAWQRVLNYSITVPFQRDGSSQARDGMIIAQVNNGYSATETHFVAIYLNGGLLTQTGSSQIIDWPVIMTPATLNSGANIIELYWYGASANVFCGTRMMTTLMRAK